MALTVNRLPQAVSEIMSGINLGIQNALDHVDAVRPPEKVIFSGDIITGVNEIPRQIVEDNSPFVRVTVSSPVTTIDRVSLDGVYNHTDTTVEGESVVTETISSGAKVTRFFEDNAIGMEFIYPGAKQN